MSLETKDKPLKSHLTTYKMKLTTLSPLFVGGGEDSVLNKTQYILDLKSNKIHILNEKEWSSFLMTRSLFENYLDYISRIAERQQSRPGEAPPAYQGDLYGWLTKNGVSPNEFSRFVKYSVDAKNVERGHDLRCFIKNVDLMPYIPGSSIKGAIRSAYLFAMIKKKQTYFSEKYWRDLKFALENGNKRDANKIASQVEREILFNVEYKDHNPNKINAINDMFKGLIVSDSTPIKAENLTVLKKLDLSTHGGKNNQYLSPLPIFREYLKPKTECHFTLTVDTHIIKDELWLDFKKLNMLIVQLANFLVEPEDGIYDTFAVPEFNVDIRFPDSEYKQEGDLLPNLCLGGGSGFHSKVITYVLAPKVTEASETLKYYFDKTFTKWDRQTRQKAPAHNHVRLDKVVSPRTLKLAEYNNENHIVGWCDIREVGKIC